MEQKFKWFTPDNIFSYNALFNFVTGLRGVGKTYGCLKWAIKRFLKTGKKFIYLRRFKDELKGDEMEQLLTELSRDKDLGKVEIFTKGRRFYCENKECGQIMFLSVQQGKKSLPYPDTDTIIFDEFIIEKGYQRYLPDEPSKLMSFCETIFRNRPNTRCICLSNSTLWVNPYFLFYKFKPMEEGFQVIKDGTVLLCMYKNKEFEDVKKESRFGKAIEGTKYAEVSIENKFADVNDDFIKKKPANSYLQLNILWNSKTYGLWYSPEEYCYVVSNKYNPDERTICYTTKDLKPNMMLLSDTRNNINVQLKRAFKNSYLYFEDIYIRDEMFDLFNYMGIR